MRRSPENNDGLSPDLRALVARLDAAGADERADLASARETALDAAALARFDAAARALVTEPPAQDGADLVREAAGYGPEATSAPRSIVAGEHAERGDSQSARPRDPWRALRVAAAVIGVVSLVLVLARPPAQRADLPLGAAPIEIALVAGAPAGTLSWTDALPPGGHWEITVTGVDADGRELTLVRSATTREPRWSPPPAAATWPDRLHVDVVAVDASGAPAAFGSRSLRLR